MPFMNVDIVVPTYNRYEILSESLQSIRSQTHRQWECWIAEDGESQKTRETVEPFLSDNRFHYLPGGHSGSPATPRNRAIMAGRAPYIAFLDDDDIWLPHKLERQIGFLLKHPACVILGTNAYIMRENQDYRKEALPVYFQKAPFGLVPYKKLVQQDYLINSSVIIQRSALKYAGLQNETLHKGPDGEDYDLWLRVGTLGEIWLMETPLVVYRNFSSKNISPKRPAMEKRREAYRMKYKIYKSALDGVGEMPSPLSFPEHERQERLCRKAKKFCGAGPRFLGRLQHDISLSLANLVYLKKSKRKKNRDAIRAFVGCKAKWGKSEKPSTLECVIFSRDRALQLHALLSTYVEQVSPVVPVHVLYHTSTQDHQKGYDDLMHMFVQENIRYIKQTAADSFKHDLLEVLFSSTSDAVLFLVDDIVFTEWVDLNDLLKFDTDMFVPSLRLGKNITHCYVLQTPQPSPPFLDNMVKDPDKIVWQWDQGQLDWNYPLSVDGHLFARREIAAMAALLTFNAPNSFEDQLQNFRSFFSSRYGVAYKKSKIVNIPCNRVQTEIENLSGHIHQDQLLIKWREGYRIDYRSLYGYNNSGAHEELPFHLVKEQPNRNGQG